LDDEQGDEHEANPADDGDPTSGRLFQRRRDGQPGGERKHRGVEHGRLDDRVPRRTMARRNSGQSRMYRPTLPARQPRRARRSNALWFTKIVEGERPVVMLGVRPDTS
jgi:hypothetical protein